MSLDLKFDHTKSNNEKLSRLNDDRLSRDIGKNQFALSLITRIAIAIAFVWTVNTVLQRIDKNDDKPKTTYTTTKLKNG